MVWFVELLNSESVTEIEDYTNKAAWHTALWNKVVIFIRNNETSSDEMKAPLSQDTCMAIKDWVHNNSSAVVFSYGQEEPAHVLTGINFTNPTQIRHCGEKLYQQDKQQ